MSTAGGSGDMIDNVTMAKGRGSDALECILDRINTIHKDLKKDISVLRSDNQEIHKNLNNFKEEIKAITTGIKSDLIKLKSKLTAVNKENLCLKDCISNLQASLNENTQVLKFNKIKVMNIPSNTDEDILAILKKISSIIGFDSIESKLEECYRLNKTRKPNTAPVVFKFFKNSDKLCFLDSYKRYVKNNILLLNSVLSTCNETNSNVQLYIAEYMSPQTYKLFRQAKDLQRMGKAKFVWFRNNKILVRKDVGIPAVLIRSEKDIQQWLGHSDVTALSEIDTEMDGVDTDMSESSKSGTSKKRKIKRSPKCSIKSFLRQK